MVNVTPIDEAKRNFVAGAAGAGTKYGAAIDRVSDWQTKTASEASETLYAQKLQEAIAAKRRQRGIQRTSNDEWKKAAKEKGAARISQGMTAAQDKWAKEVTPYLGAMASLTLPDKSADPMANIDQRLKPVVAALVAKKKEIKG